MEFATDFTGDGWPDVLACKFIDADMGLLPVCESTRRKPALGEVYRVLDKFDSEVAVWGRTLTATESLLLYTAADRAMSVTPSPIRLTRPVDWIVHNVSGSRSLTRLMESVLAT